MLDDDEFITAGVMLGIVDHIIWSVPAGRHPLVDGSVEFEIGIDPSRQHLVGDYHFHTTCSPAKIGFSTARRRRDDGAPVNNTAREVSEKLPELLANQRRDVVVDFDLDYLSTNHPGLTGAAAEAGIPYKTN